MHKEINKWKNFYYKIEKLKTHPLIYDEII